MLYQLSYALSERIDLRILLESIVMEPDRYPADPPVSEGPKS